MKFEVVLSDKAKTDIERFKYSGDIKSLRKIRALLKELELHPSKGTGKPKVKIFQGIDLVPSDFTKASINI